MCRPGGGRGAELDQAREEARQRLAAAGRGDEQRRRVGGAGEQRELVRVRLPAAAGEPAGEGLGQGGGRWHDAGIQVGPGPGAGGARPSVAAAAGVDVVGEDRGGGADEEAVPLAPTEADVGADLGDEDLAEEGAVRGEAVDAVAGRAPDVAAGVDAEAVEGARLADREVVAVVDGLAVERDRVGADLGLVVGAVAAAGVADVEQRLVGREGDAVRLDEVVDDEGDGAVIGVDAVDVARRRSRTWRRRPRTRCRCRSSGR